MTDQLKYLELAETLAGRSFHIHAEQRMKLMNFYLVLFAGSLTFLGSNWNVENFMLLIAVGVSLLIITFTFKQLDRRTAELIKRAEASLDKIEEQIEISLFSEVRLVKMVQQGSGNMSYRQSLNLLYLLGTCFSLISIATGLYFYCKT